jgi:hypothetical protein
VLLLLLLPQPTANPTTNAAATAVMTASPLEVEASLSVKLKMERSRSCTVAPSYVQPAPSPSETHSLSGFSRASGSHSPASRATVKARTAEGSAAAFLAKRNGRFGREANGIGADYRCATALGPDSLAAERIEDFCH